MLVLYCNIIISLRNYVFAGYMSDMIPSTLLVSPPHSDDDVAGPSRCAPEFVERDLGSVTLMKGMKFPSSALFKEAVKEANIAIGKDIRFHKNTGDKVVIVCRSEKCKYRVYGRKIPNELSFEIRDIQPQHRCPRRYRLSQISFRWITKKMIDQIKSQPNMSVSAIYDEVKRKWQCETRWQKCYQAKKRALEEIYGTHKEQYGKVWDYCATVRDTNRGSCLIVMTDRITPELPPFFQRLYVSFNAMRTGFKMGCRPLICLDGCFLKGEFKGKLLSVVAGDANNNMYSVAFAIVEAELKDSWIWFLETLIGDLGTAPQGGWTFMSDRQKVTSSLI